MNLRQIATRSLRHYWSTNLAIALGVAAATAVLTGALIVGESMRSSLRELTLQRLGKIDEMLVSDGFFRTALADEISQLETFQQHYDQIEPAILFPGGTVANEQTETIRYAGQVSVLGITDQFWQFEQNTTDQFENETSFTGDVAIINQALADDLGITAADIKDETATITVRVPKQTQLPADSALGRKTDLIESLVDLRVVEILPNQGLARFGLFPSQADPLNVFVPIELLQDSLARTVLKHKATTEQANVLLLSSNGSSPPSEAVTETLSKSIRPTLADVGLQLKQVTQSTPDGKPVFAYTSLSSDKLVLPFDVDRCVRDALPEAKPVFTYLANDIRTTDQESGIPFSMLAGIDFDTANAPAAHQFRPVSAITSKPIQNPADDQIVLNQWAAEDLDLKIGDRVTVAFFEPETTHRSQTERTVEFEISDIATITTPDAPFGYNRRQGVIPPTYSRPPTVANDPDLTPVVPGVTDAESIEEWDLPFATADKIRPQDDDYWENFRTTPKAFINLATSKKLFRSRFGITTSWRIPTTAGDQAAIAGKLQTQFTQSNAELGLHLMPIKRRGLAASSGSTPFDFLFLALSMFVIGSALILVSLLFRLSIQQRASEVGLLKAAGFAPKRLRNLWLAEMSLVSLLGALLGLALGVGYAAVMIKGLTTWWVGAIARPFLTMHVSWVSLLIGLVSGVLACVLTIAISLRRTNKQPVTQLLRGELESSTVSSKSRTNSRLWIVWLMVVCAIGLAAFATQLAGEPQAGAFMGAGFLLLAAGLSFVYMWLSGDGDQSTVNLSLSRMALLSAKRNPLRSTLTIGLVAVASFLIAAVSAFRLTPNEAGTAGFDWIGTSSQPVFEDLQTSSGQSAALGKDHLLPAAANVFSCRYKPGEDASCNNLYQSTQPRVLGLPADFFTRQLESESKFAWAGSLSETENPWEPLSNETVHTGTAEDPIPVVIDKNTANYSLKIFALGTVKEVHYDSGESFHFKAVGFLSNTIFQGGLLMSQQDFLAAFPEVAGYQYFLIDDNGGADDQEIVAETTESATVKTLEDRLSDLGFDARSAPKLLANFMTVQNTYLSTFQTLGALGLLLGTLGLAAVQIRSVLERKRQLGLLRAVGFQLPQLSRLVMLENAWLLLIGLAVGIGSALLTTVPHWLTGAASVPWLALVAIFVGITLVGLIAGWLASRSISQVPLLESLRD